ncbi:RNA polymerase sigma factor [Fredinandcohnia sp. 179-A 10B2 NHS]|uniref:RNA polymerase sigma factor n=1 Tax=Fredinandcohnia sp. 179-A 10B2 NHS TaxID=3235176 RepID=UPI0039A38130
MNHTNQMEEWFYQYGDDVYNFLVYLTGTKDVEDIVQEVFLKALRSISSFEARANPKTWLLTIARNLVIDKSRRKKLFTFFPIDIAQSKLAATDYGDPEKTLLSDETQSEIYYAILSLKQSYKDVLILRLIVELTVDETASVLNWSNSKVTLTYHRAIKALQKKIKFTIEGGTNGYERTLP